MNVLTNRVVVWCYSCEYIRLNSDEKSSFCAVPRVLRCVHRFMPKFNLSACLPDDTFFVCVICLSLFFEPVCVCVCVIDAKYYRLCLASINFLYGSLPRMQEKCERKCVVHFSEHFGKMFCHIVLTSFCGRSASVKPVFSLQFYCHITTMCGVQNVSKHFNFKILTNTRT